MVKGIFRKYGSLLILSAISIAVQSCRQGVESTDQPLLFLPNDLEATLWAESPMFYNPTNMDIDSKGRVWITEAVNYRNYNNDSSRHMHHNGGDRVMILEDSDGDGKADKAKVFVQDKDLVSPLGIAVIGNKVFVSCSPNLIVYTDDNGDDQPDRKEIFLTGFGGLDHDHSLHAIVGGPDGKLYFPTGNAGPHIVTDKSGWTLRSGSMYTGGSPYNTENSGNMKSDDGKVWVGGLALRMSSEGRNLEVIGHNFRNAYELAVDSRGDLWQNDNDDQVVACRTTWLMEGGNAGYFSTDGTRSWQADQRPGQDAFTAHWHQDDPGVIPAGDRSGAGAPTGIVMYEDDALGESYRGMLLSADAGRNVVFGYHPKRDRSGFDIGRRMNFITSLQDDNEAYVWNDSLGNSDVNKWFRPSDIAIGIEGAIYVADWYDPVVGGHQMEDSTGYGRIYLIQPKGRKLSRPQVDMSNKAGLLKAFLNPAVNVSYEAGQKLEKMGASIVADVEALFDSQNAYHRARAIWLMSRLGGEGRSIVERLLTHRDEDMRIVAFRALRSNNSNISAYAQKLADDPSPFVRREIAISMADQPYDLKRPILLALLKNFDSKDRWYLEAIGNAVSGDEDRFAADAARILNDDNSPPEEWTPEMEALMWRLHPVSYVDQLRRRAQSARLSPAERERAITAIAFVNDPAAVNAMLDLTASSLPDVAEQSTYWISFRQGNDWFSLADWNKTRIDPVRERQVAAMKVKMSNILDEKMPWDEKRRSVRDMAKNEIGSKMLLSLISEGKLPKDLNEAASKILLTSADQTVRIQASQYFTPANKHNYDIRSIATFQSDPAKGKLIFEDKCSSCHKLGSVGKDIGPDLTTINKKFGKIALMEAVVNPSAGIVFGYEAWTINTKDGQSHFGFLVADGKEAVTVKDLTGVQRSIAVDNIVSREKLSQSVMPDASGLGLNDQQLADLTEFIMNP